MSIEDWDSLLSDSGGAHSGKKNFPFPYGTYDFKIIDFTKSQYKGSTKIPPCPMAVIKMEVDCNGIPYVVYDNMYLHEKMRWKIVNLFVCVGFMRRGQQFYKPEWDKLVGATGRATFSRGEYTDRSGVLKESISVSYRAPKQKQPQVPTYAPTYDYY